MGCAFRFGCVRGAKTNARRASSRAPARRGIGRGLRHLTSPSSLLSDVLRHGAAESWVPEVLSERPRPPVRHRPRGDAGDADGRSRPRPRVRAHAAHATRNHACSRLTHARPSRTFLACTSLLLSPLSSHSPPPTGAEEKGRGARACGGILIEHVGRGEDGKPRRSNNGPIQGQLKPSS